MTLPEIIYEDADILVCYKPAGLAVQTKRLGQQDLETGLKNYRARKKEPPYIGVVHRLDQPVEGVMVFGKTREATAALSKQVQGREIGKYYYAVGTRTAEKTGKVLVKTGEKGRLTDYLAFDARKNLGYVSDKNDREAKKAVLDYEVMDLSEDGKKVRFRITLHTGRHHQIRLQLANLGCPLQGDSKYGGMTEDADGQKLPLALCSYRLEFVHPRSGKRMEFSIKPRNL